MSSSSAQVFTWLVNLTTVGGFFTWMAINVTYLRFYAGLKRQGIDRTKFIYFSRLQPYLSIWGVFWTTFCILVNGFDVFWDFNASDFLTACTFFFSLVRRAHADAPTRVPDINLPIFVALWIFWRLLKRTRFWKNHEMDFVTVRLFPLPPLSCMS